MGEAGPGGRQEGGREETGTLEERERLAGGKGENKQIRPPGEARSGQRNNQGGRPSPAQAAGLLFLRSQRAAARLHRPGLRQDADPAGDPGPKPACRGRGTGTPVSLPLSCCVAPPQVSAVGVLCNSHNHSGDGAHVSVLFYFF